MQIVQIGNKSYKFAGTKADLARRLLSEGHSAAAIAKAVPMAYSQVHSIAQKLKADVPKAVRRSADILPPQFKKERAKPIAEHAGGKRPTSKARVAEAKVWAGKRVDQAIGGIASKVKAVGECINCGFGLEVRKLAGQMQLIHVGGSQEDYFNVIQFCHGVPASLV